jgi:hypothetical protein
MNLSLLCKWLWKIDREDGLWQQIIKFKYLRKDTICSVHHKQSDSPIWADLLKVRDIYMQGRKFIIGNGKKILFWKDRWLFDQPLSVLLPDLFKMAKQHDITLAEVKGDPDNISFSRWLVRIWKEQWDSIISDMSKIHFNNCDDLVTWNFSPKGLFIVKSVYNALTSNESGPYHKKNLEMQNPS